MLLHVPSGDESLICVKFSAHQFQVRNYSSFYQKYTRFLSGFKQQQNNSRSHDQHFPQASL